MNILIAGGGEIGKYLASSLHTEGNNISLIEIKEEACKELAQELDVLIICGDATDVAALKDAGAASGDVFVAVTDDDNTNLVACQLAKNEFNVNHTIARVNDESKEELFEKMEIDSVITMTNAAATSFKNAIRTGPLKTIFSYGDEDVELNEVLVDEESKVLGKKLIDVDLPRNSVVVSILREDDVIFPRGETVFEEGDRVQLLMYSKNVDKIKELF